MKGLFYGIQFGLNDLNNANDVIGDSKLITFAIQKYSLWAWIEIR